VSLPKINQRSRVLALPFAAVLCRLRCSLQIGRVVERKGGYDEISVGVLRSAFADLLRRQAGRQ
jgi:hypothetical protein